jgi:Zn-dependent metalloprotease
MITKGSGSRRRLRREALLTGSLEQIFQTASLMQVETLETRQMLSSVVLTSDQLVESAMAHLRENAGEYGLTVDDLNDFVVTDQYTTDHLGIRHIYFRQTYQGLEIRDANINVNVRMDGEVVSAGNRFIGGV